MISLACILVFMGFYTSYYTSKKAVLYYDYGFERWVRNNPKHSKKLGLSLILLAYLFLVFSNALGAGTLIFFIELMVIGSLIIILKPLKIISSKAIFVFFLTILLLEMYS